MPWPTYFLLIRTKNWSSSSLSSSLDYHTHRFINYRQCDLNESSKFWFLFLPAEKKGFVVGFFFVEQTTIKIWVKRKSTEKILLHVFVWSIIILERERERERHWEFEMTNIFKCKYPKKMIHIYMKPGTWRFFFCSVSLSIHIFFVINNHN